ncbi:ABC transporter permease [Mesorhizobium sp. WSM4976]|uniref:ABC transporter permease n=1 Tax=Mesorhizobium sp. WSM4976 TaxID=3038549 RepID=UPI00241723AE|nr:ABC transporter permease [Mesorhizobium sp. WSM4976]MDG4898455.1 ABC transporter permease [Mesorhizobium sp. WSM4976]
MTLAQTDSTMSEATDQPIRASRKPVVPWFLIAPALVIVLVFFGLPTLQMARMSFNLHVDQRLYVPGFTFEHYRTLFTNPLFSNAIWTTVQLALVASFFSVAIGFTFAILAWLKPARWRLLFVGLALCPLLISEIAIIFGWWMFFPKNGLLSQALFSAGLITDKISLMYTEFAAFVGLVYVTLPYAFFILLSVLDGIDKQILESSADLGASPLVTFQEVLFPLTRTGLLVAFSQSFIWAMGTYATPSALGPDTLWTMGFLIQEQMLGKHNWPLASAFSMLLVVGVAATMLLTRSLMSTRSAFHV